MWAIAAWMLLVTGGVGMDADSPETDFAPAAPAVQVIEPNSYAQERYLTSTAPVRLFSSRVGRGKSHICCASEHLKACALPGIQIALTRLERSSMENTTLETLRRLVPPAIWATGWSASKSCLSYPPVLRPDGKIAISRIWVFGWLDPGRALSAEFGSIAVDQAEQLEYRHYTTALTRLRQNDEWVNERAKQFGLAARQISLLCNPEDNEHWIAKEFDPEAGMRLIKDGAGRVRADVILSGFSDNEQNLPSDYRENLESLKGSVQYERLVMGRWARAEGLVFPMWDAAQHFIPRPVEWAEWNGFPPPDWKRYRGIDFGLQNPFVCLWVAVSPEGKHYVYREWSQSGRIVEDHAHELKRLEAEELEALRSAPALDSDRAVAYRPYLNELHIADAFADHDAEDAATLARHGIRTRPAKKSIRGVIDCITSGLNKGTLYVVNGSLVKENAAEANAKLPTSLARELSSYRWQHISDKSKNPVDAKKEKPVDANNHRIDALGYVLYSLASTARPSVWVG